jgi:hypothetical protein
MLTRKLFIAAATLFALAPAAVAGCAVDATDDSVEGTEDDLTKAGKALIGSYQDDTGAFRGLVLTAEKVGQQNKFFADVDTGVRCITTPCPSSERIEGTFSAGTKKITLRSTTASQYAQHLLGKYDYVVQGDKLSLFRTGFAQSLEKTVSYCAESNDCYRQDIIHPMCLGQFTCGAQNSCDWSCSPHPFDPCKGLDEAACNADARCEAKYGPSVCSADGLICTHDYVFKGCSEKPEPPPGGAVCLSSDSCDAGEYCSTEDGVCNPYGMLAVCAGTCVPGAPGQN